MKGVESNVSEESDSRLVHKDEVGSTPTGPKGVRCSRRAHAQARSRSPSEQKSHGKGGVGGGQLPKPNDVREPKAGSTAPTRQCEGGGLPSCGGTTAMHQGARCVLVRTGEADGTKRRRARATEDSRES